MRHLPDVFAIIGGSLIVTGVALIYVPAAFILAGTALVYVGYRTQEAPK